MLLTVKQVAKRLNVSLSSVYELIHDGALTSYRIGRNGGAIRVSDDDLEVYLAKSRTGEASSTKPNAPQQVKLKHLRV